MDARPPGPTALWIVDRSRLFAPHARVLDAHSRLVADRSRDGMWMLGGWFRLRAVRGSRFAQELLGPDGLGIARTSGVGRGRWTVTDVDGAGGELHRRSFAGRCDHVVDDITVGEIRRGLFPYRIRAVVDLPALPPLLRVLAGLALVDCWDAPAD